MVKSYVELEIDTVIFKEFKMHEKETKWYQIFLHLLKQKNKQYYPEYTEGNKNIMEK